MNEVKLIWEGKTIEDLTKQAESIPLMLSIYRVFYYFNTSKEKNGGIEPSSKSRSLYECLH